MASITSGILEIEGSPLEGENPLPLFRNGKHDTDVRLREGFPDRYKALLGHETGFRILPYTRQDRYRREKKTIPLRTIVLENDILRAVFLPEYGARLFSLVSKKDGREILYRNPVFQPANLAIRNAWFSGGIEWNAGQYGHGFSTCSPVFCSVQKDASGQDFLRVYDYERCKGFFWHIDFHLDAGSDLLCAHTGIHNIDIVEKSMYWWTNTAVAQNPGSRVFSPSAEVIYIDPFVKKGERRFGFGAMPELDILPGIDASYPERLTYSNEYFFACDREDLPWEAALDADGKGFFEASTGMLKYRKMFCWGSLPGSKRWAEFLSREGDNYFEIQAGLAPTQLHGTVMPPSTVWSWTQVFGLLEAEPDKAHDPDWAAASSHVGSEVAVRIPRAALEAMHEACLVSARSPCGEIIDQGSGWGALELERRRIAGENGLCETFLFPPGSMDGRQKPWLELLHTGTFPDKNPVEIPFDFLVQDEWEVLLRGSLAGAACTVANGTAAGWNALLHLGVMAMERGDSTSARVCWERSLALRESAWAYRNLACLEIEEGDTAAALHCYRKAASSPGYTVDRAIAEEYLTLLVASGNLDEGIVFYETLDPAWQRDSDVLAVQHAYLCVRTGNIEEAEAFLRRNVANIREGETPLSDIWFETEALKYARDRNLPLTESIRRHIRETARIPAPLDFGML